MAERDRIAQLRAIAGDKGFRIERAPPRDCWFLVHEATGELAISERGTSAFTTQRAIKFLSAWNVGDSLLAPPV